MAETIKIRATKIGEIVDIKCLMNHVMETGLRKDAKSGKAVPAHLITSVRVELASRTVMDVQWGGGVSRNPYLALKVKGGEKGDTVVVSWRDDAGAGDRAETRVA